MDGYPATEPEFMVEMETFDRNGRVVYDANVRPVSDVRPVTGAPVTGAP
ncbi:MAG TPA: hypothetical protein VM942_08620 [Acidimicrobiales bacterium]|nr:hypothetical protein [Acidimicrobiales bacterium]